MLPFCYFIVYFIKNSITPFSLFNRIKLRYFRHKSPDSQEKPCSLKFIMSAHDSYRVMFQSGKINVYTHKQTN